ncbi:unnamed protein product [Hyaloperonospora brassicae]|uniref:Uncharacterized protein n=1 Tax=Hyaloperonospora brassicae TaxID=162125 RepID=A0AAV0V268_HYABA|nr:unnamed protein product [Hyaloperonospora brassicae]
MTAFLAAAREWHALLLRDRHEPFVARHLATAMQLAVALHCRDDAAAARAVDTVSAAERQALVALAVVLRPLIEVAVRDRLTFLFPEVTAAAAVGEVTLPPWERTRQQALVQSLPDAFQLPFRQLLRGHWDALTRDAQRSTHSLPRVAQLHHKCVKAEAEADTYVLLRLQTSDGATRTLRVRLQQFHQLRHSAATALQGMNDVESHPMMRLVQVETKSARTATGGTESVAET